MTLAFFPFGAFLAGLFLGAAVTVFAVAVHALDRGSRRADGSILPGLVVGFRGWMEQRAEPRIPISPDAGDLPDPVAGDDEDEDGAEAGPVIVDLR